MSRCAGRALGRLAAVLVLAATLLAVGVMPAVGQDLDPRLPQPPVPGAPAAPTPPANPEAPAAPDAPTAPDAPAGITLTLDGAEEGLSQTVTMVLLLTVAAVSPMLLLLMTTFTRFVVVLGLARNGLGLQTVPPAQVLVGLALFLALFSMGPTLSTVNDVALRPMLAGEMDALEAAQAAYEPMRDFMLSQVDERDLRMFVELSAQPAPANPSEIGATTLIPAFVISELRTAFTIGFVVFVPFLIIDLVTAAVLMSMGMVMLPPVFVSLPLKLLLFVLVDGWSLLSRSLVGSVLG